MKMIDENNKVEFIGQIIDIFEDFLEEKGISIDNPEKEDDPDNAAIIYGSDYGMLQDDLEAMFTAWGIIEERKV